MRLSLLLLGFGLTTLQPCWGENRVFAVRPITVNEGLSQNHVTSFAQDRQGFVWIGTGVGLNRYDGHEFKVYTHKREDKSSISGDAIYAIHVDAQGRVWVGTDRGLDLYVAATDSFRHFRGLTGTDGSPVRRARAIASDSGGGILVSLSASKGFPSSSVVRLDPASGRFESLLVEEQQIEPVFIHAVGEHRIVIVLKDSTGIKFPRGFAVTILDRRNGTAKRILPAVKVGPPPVPTGERDISFASSGPDTLWIGARGDQIFRFNPDSGELAPYTYDSSLGDSAGTGLVSHVVAGSDGEVWVIPTWDRPGRRSGGAAIYRLTGDHRAPQKSSLNSSGACDFTKSFVISSQIDRAGVLWAGLSGAGFCVSDLQSGMFSRIHESSPGVRLSNDFVRSVWKTPSGILWVGTRVGVDRIDRRHSRVDSYRATPGAAGSLSDGEVMALVVGRDNTLWVGTQRGGLNRDAQQRGVFEHFRHIPGNPRSLAADHVSALLEDRQGVLWVATGGGGLSRFHAADRTFTSYSYQEGDPASISSNDVTTLFEDSRGAFWVGTRDAGLNRFDRAAGRFATVSLGLAEPPNIVSLDEDPATPGVIWIATLRHGLIRYDPATEGINHYTASNSLLPSDTVFSVLADDQDSIWAGTNRGLVRVGAKPESFRIFGIDQGLQSMEYNSRACFRAADGEMFLGGVGGLNAFYPRDITQNNRPARVVITQVRTMNRVLFRNDGSTPSADLGPGNPELIFHFVALHFADPGRNAYRFRLDGFDDAWRDAGASREATYTNLPPGSYRFRVRAVTSRGVWSEEDAAFSFTIGRPFYQTPWFILLAIVSSVTLAYSAFRLRLRQMRAAERMLQAEVSERTQELTQALDLIGQQAEQLRETDSLKSRFITNVSHDFRTPLSVTLGTLTDLQAGLYGSLPGAAAQELETVVRNERRLLRLVNQLLAVARLESGKLRLRVWECDLTSLAGDIVAAFASVARQRDISLELNAAEEPIRVFCDPEWMEQVITNLLLNALKFTPPGGRVAVSTSLRSDPERICLAVEDTGPGIPAEALPRIFDRFYQAEQGATTPHAGIGVGLSLAREIVELHSGEIQVASVAASGSVFTILLKPGQAHFDQADLAEGRPRQGISNGVEGLADDLLSEHPGPISSPAEDSDKPALVVAEDDDELRAFLCKHLQGDYRVLEARSGTEALQLIRSEIPDLVLSDIMMPGMDGHELCREIRQSPETDFIPVILLTARATIDQKLEGLQHGADDYVIKPFEAAELQLRIRNCIEARARLKTRLAATYALDSAKAFDSLPDSADALFLRRVYDAIRENAQDDSFSVEQLAGELAVSRMHLYRRLRAIAGKAPAEVIMDYRLERAAQLLSARSGAVSEVAYAVGFKSVSHFARRFREKFGCAPSEYKPGADSQVDSGKASEIG